MNRLLIGLLIAALAGFGLWKLGVFGSDAPVEPAPEGGGRGDRPDGPVPGGPIFQPGAGTAAREVPKEQPRPEWFPLTEPLRVLFVIQRANPWLALHSQVLGSAEEGGKVEASLWVADPGVDPVPLPKTTWIRELPNGQWFDAQEFHVLVVGGIDPAVLPDDFWQAVTRRVTSGRTGLWAYPDMPPTSKGTSVTPAVHPMLTHPLFAALLPVVEAARLEARPEAGKPNPLPPGIFRKEAPFVVTDAGTKHPASRIVAWPEWSRRIWVDGGQGLQPWGSQFCYPVTKVSPSAVTLVSIAPEAEAVIPMLVVRSGAGGRVLWFGARDFGDATYRIPAALEKWNALLHNSIVWLAGRAPAEDR